MGYGNGSDCVKDHELQKKFDAAHGKNVHGGDQQAEPSVLEEIDQETFFNRLSVFPAYGQVWSCTKHGNLQMFVQCLGDMSGVGFGKVRVKAESGVYKYVNKFFQFSKCDHKYEGVSRGRCYTEYTCVKCGASYSVDSSD